LVLLDSAPLPFGEVFLDDAEMALTFSCPLASVGEARAIGSHSGAVDVSLEAEENVMRIIGQVPFSPGERIWLEVTSPTAVGGQRLADPVRLEFRGQAGLASGGFEIHPMGSTAHTDDVVVGDLDGDGDIDAVFAGGAEFGGPNDVLLNDGTGTFTHQSLGEDAAGVGLGDLDGDGDLDIVLTFNERFFDEPAQVWLNDGAGVFTDSGRTIGDMFAWKVALGDIDHDGDLDAVFANLDSSDGGAPNQVWLNDGTGNFSDSGQALGNARSHGVVLADVNADGHLDALVANYGTSGEGNRVYLNDGTGTFTDSLQSLGSDITDRMGVADVDGDGAPDLIANTVFRNDGQGVFEEAGAFPDMDATTAATVGDLDGDGDVDYLISSWGFSDEPTTWFRNAGTGKYEPMPATVLYSDASETVLADFNGDGVLDVMVANHGENVLLMGQ
jgi:hypothetical protein